MKLKVLYVFACVLAIVLFTECSEASKEEPVSALQAFTSEMSLDSIDYDPFQLTLKEVSFPTQFPLLQSFVAATYQNYWILLGGRKSGLHSMDNDPPAFGTQTANDSIWLIDMTNQTVTGVGVPTQYASFLSATNMLDFQVGDNFYIGGGFTTQTPSSTQSDWTSDRLFEISLPSLVQYIQSGGTTPSLDVVFTKVIQNPFLQVTGGEMIVVNDNFYLVCGQNYQGTYSSGNTGTYTDAIRKFNLGFVDGAWTLTDTLSLVDPVNLHRRDYNLVPAINNSDDSLRAVIYGGVFTSDGLGYRSPVYISGLASGQPSIEVDDVLEQEVNLYSCAQVLTAMKSSLFWLNHHSLLGGITYKYYDPNSGKLQVPSKGLDLPFSNMISSLLTDGESGSREAVQLPPHEMLPAYLGSNAVFFPEPAFIMSGTPEIMDLNLIFQDYDNEPVAVGYMLGGIRSDHPNTVTPGGNFLTYVNPKLYQVFMNIETGE